MTCVVTSRALSQNVASGQGQLESEHVKIGRDAPGSKPLDETNIMRYSMRLYLCSVVNFGEEVLVSSSGIDDIYKIFQPNLKSQSSKTP